MNAACIIAAEIFSRCVSPFLSSSHLAVIHSPSLFFSLSSSFSLSLSLYFPLLPFLFFYMQQEGSTRDTEVNAYRPEVYSHNVLE